jgi:hypothetical protein
MLNCPPYIHRHHRTADRGSELWGVGGLVSAQVAPGRLAGLVSRHVAYLTREDLSCRRGGP